MSVEQGIRQRKRIFSSQRGLALTTTDVHNTAIYVPPAISRRPPRAKGRQSSESQL